MKVLLVCAAGMSTSMLVKKMRDYAKDKGVDLDIDARPVGELKDGEGLDAVLLGPQVSYQKDNVVKTVGDTPVGVIPVLDYGRQNCPNIFKLIDELTSK